MSKDPDYEHARDWLFRNLAPDQELNLTLTNLGILFKQDPANSLPAFEAIASIASRHWLQEDSTPPDECRVPWWAVEAIAAGYCQYRVRGRGTPRHSFGEAFQVEGGGQGKRPKLDKFLQRLRDQRLALGIALRVAQGNAVEAAIAEVADEIGDNALSEKRLWEIWGDLGDHARQIVQATGASNFGKSSE